jgi:uncharacterized protein
VKYPLLLSTFQAGPILRARSEGGKGIVSTADLGVSKAHVEILEEGARFPDGLIVSWELLEEIRTEERKVFRIEGDEAHPVQAFSEDTGWVRVLSPTVTAPTVFVSGKPMHRIKGTDPMKDTKSKIAALGSVRGRVLDTATGLGYTAVEAAKTAKEVVTIELDPAALDVARQNPWSRGLFERKNIRQILGDTFEVVVDLAPGSFEGIVHDPPTASLGGELYSEEFYRRLHRLLNRRGKLYHYCGDPTSGLGKSVTQGVMRRLAHAGFRGVTRHPEAFGVTAIP